MTGTFIVEAEFVRRGMRHTLRNPDALVTALALPIIILLLFVYVFGGAISTRGEYIDYVVPGIIVLCAMFGAAGTAVGVCTDKVAGVMDRFRTMPIRGASVLTGHVVASLLRNLVSTAHGRRAGDRHRLPPRRHAARVARRDRRHRARRCWPSPGWRRPPGCSRRPSSRRTRWASR